MAYLISALIGYGLGCISPSYILARIHGFDIREKGSKNAGASNILITLGKARGFLCAAFDIAKAAKELNLDAIHDTVHEMAKDEARHGKGFIGLLERYFGE